MQPELQSLIPLAELTRKSLEQEGQDGRSKDKLCAHANSNMTRKVAETRRKRGSQSETEAKNVRQRTVWTVKRTDRVMKCKDG